MIRIEVAPAGESAHAETVRQWLRAYNLEHNRAFMEYRDANDAVPMNLFAFENERIVGGLFAETILSWLKISIMAVDPEFRRKGIGGQLLLRAENLAVERGCRQSFVDTMSYQAPEFYERRGYIRAGTLPDWDSFGHAKYFFIKSLA